jgi:hypothetical protein
MLRRKKSLLTKAIDINSLGRLWKGTLGNGAFCRSLEPLLAFGALIRVCYNEISVEHSQVVDFHRVLLVGRKKEI